MGVRVCARAGAGAVRVRRVVYTSGGRWIKHGEGSRQDGRVDGWMNRAQALRGSRTLIKYKVVIISLYMYKLFLFNSQRAVWDWETAFGATMARPGEWVLDG